MANSSKDDTAEGWHVESVDRTARVTVETVEVALIGRQASQQRRTVFTPKSAVELLKLLQASLSMLAQKRADKNLPPPPELFPDQVPRFSRIDVAVDLDLKTARLLIQMKDGSGIQMEISSVGLQEIRSSMERALAAVASAKAPSNGVH